MKVTPSPILKKRRERKRKPLEDEKAWLAKFAPSRPCNSPDCKLNTEKRTLGKRAQKYGGDRGGRARTLKGDGTSTRRKRRGADDVS